MKAPSTMASTFPPRARGMAIIELALIMGTMAFLLPVIFSLGHLFYVYAVLKQTAAAAAATLATAPPSEWASGAAASSTMKLRTVALIEKSLLDARVAPLIPLLEYDFDCNGNLVCGGERPDSITVSLVVAVPNSFHYVTEMGIPSSMMVQTAVTVPYSH